MTWTKRTGNGRRETEFLSAMLPEWFAADIDTGTPKDVILQKLSQFTIEAEQFVAAEEKRDPLPVPDAEYIEHLYELYTDVLRQIQEAA